MHFNKIIASFQRHQKSLNKATSTIDWYNTLLHRFFDFIENQGITKLSEINPQTMLAYKKYISNLQNKKGEHYSVAVQNLHLIVIRTLYRYLLRIGKTKTDPTVEIELSRIPDALPRNILTESEIFLLLDQPTTQEVFGLRDKCIMELLYSTGMRRMEILGLDVTDINMDTNAIHIRIAKGSKHRIVPFGIVAKRYLKLYLTKRPDLIKKRRKNSALFLSINGNRMDKQTMGRIIHAYAKQAGITKNVTPSCIPSHLCYPSTEQWCRHCSDPKTARTHKA